MCSSMNNICSTTAKNALITNCTTTTLGGCGMKAQETAVWGSQMFIYNHNRKLVENDYDWFIRITHHIKKITGMCKCLWEKLESLLLETGSVLNKQGWVWGQLHSLYMRFSAIWLFNPRVCITLIKRKKTAYIYQINIFSRIRVKERQDFSEFQNEEFSDKGKMTRINYEQVLT